MHIHAQERAGILVSGYHDGCIVRISESLPIGECHLGGAHTMGGMNQGRSGETRFMLQMMPTSGLVLALTALRVKHK